MREDCADDSITRLVSDRMVALLVGRLDGGAACWERAGQLDGGDGGKKVELDGWMAALLVGSELHGWMAALLVGESCGANACWKRAGRLDGGGGAAGWERAGRLDGGGAAGWKRAVGPMRVGRELYGWMVVVLLVGKERDG